MPAGRHVGCKMKKAQLCSGYQGGSITTTSAKGLTASSWPTSETTHSTRSPMSTVASTTGLEWSTATSLPFQPRRAAAMAMVDAPTNARSRPPSSRVLPTMCSAALFENRNVVEGCCRWWRVASRVRLAARRPQSRTWPGYLRQGRRAMRSDPRQDRLHSCRNVA